MVCRPNAQFDDDIGFLPGPEQEKIAPMMRPVIDNLEQLIDTNSEDDENALNNKIAEFFDRGIIQMKAINYIRGRSITKTFLIIDEAQNMTSNQIKGIIIEKTCLVSILTLDKCSVEIQHIENTKSEKELCSEFSKKLIKGRNGFMFLFLPAFYANGVK